MRFLLAYYTYYIALGLIKYHTVSKEEVCHYKILNAYCHGKPQNLNTSSLMYQSSCLPGNTRGGERLVNINTKIKEEQVSRTIAKKTSGRVVMPSVLLGKRDNPSQSGQMQMK